MATGHKNSGRRNGTPNKTTASVKQALAEAFDRLGGVESLTTWARENPGDFYSLWAKLLLKELKADVNANAATGLADRLQRARERVRQERVEAN